jgi:uncharacterized protein YegP (UPF0339 family)
MAAKFEVYKGGDGNFRWHLTADNGETIASGQRYTSKAAAEKGIQSVKDNAPSAEVVHAKQPTVPKGPEQEPWPGHKKAMEKQARLKKLSRQPKIMRGKPSYFTGRKAVRSLNQRMLT